METEPEYDLAGAGDITNFATHGNYAGDDEQLEPEEFSNVPHQVVVAFIEYFYDQVSRGNVSEMQQCYENVFSRLSDRFFKTTPWPHATEIAEIVNNDPVFLMLYNELYFRHIYSKLAPTLSQRFESFENYRNLFAAIANPKEGEGLSFASVELPYQWLWDMIDEFIYQFQSFCQYRYKAKGKTPEDIALLQQNTQVWDVMAVLQTLNNLATSSQVNKWLDEDSANGKLSADVKRVPMLTMLGYFSLIGMLRVHVLLGDYYTGLKELNHIDFHRKAPLFTRVAACHISAYYYMGFAMMMLRRYADAIRAFSHILMYIHRTKQYHNRSYQFNEISRKNDAMYALLAVCQGLCPQRLDEVVLTNLREKYLDRLAKLSKGEDSAQVFEELFTFSCPKFVQVSPPQWDALSASAGSQDAHKLQLSIFLNDVQEQEKHPFIRSYLKLYTTIPVAKLGAFVGMEKAPLHRLLLSLKHKTRTTLRALTEPPLGGRPGVNTDVDFCLEGEMVHVADSKPQVPYGEFFIRHITKFEEIIAELERQ